MAKVKVWRGRWLIKCPACAQKHHLNNGWTFNGDVDAPTFSPSLLVHWDEGEERVKKVCHSYITEGRIHFLSDCTHDLAGKTVDLPEWAAEESPYAQG